MKTQSRLTIVGLITVPVTFLLMIALLWWLDFFKFSGTEASAKIVGTALTLGGGLVATMVTLIGLILRQSVEQRNADLREEAEQRMRIEAERNRALQVEAERRLQLEAAIRAVNLLGTDTGGDSSNSQRTGALFSLAHLGLTDLAISLASFMRIDSLIEADPTCALLDMALRSDDIQTQGMASEFLRDHSDKLLTDAGLVWPDYISLSWPLELNYLSRQDAVIGLINAILLRPRKEWKIERLNAFIAYLTIALRAEEDRRLKSNIALMLKEIIKIHPATYIMYLPDENLPIPSILKNIADINPAFTDDRFKLLAGKLEHWVDGKS